METSSRNSEVIHAGIYYAPGSLKARLCVEGKQQLYEYAAARGVPHRRIGKLIAAQSEAQVPALAALRTRAAANGVELRELTASKCSSLEPHVRAVAGLFSPSTGIIDSHALMQALQADVEAAGSMVLCNTRLEGAEALDGGRAGFLVTAADAATGERSTVAARAVVNAAGLHAAAVARRIAGVPPASVPRVHFAKGSYFTLAGGAAPFRHLVYPMPEDGGLGAHLTMDLGGQARFGPDVEWLRCDDATALDYAVDEARGAAMLTRVRQYWPAAPDGCLAAAYAGVRPKLAGPGGGEADFLVQGEALHGVRGLVNLYGIESPGLTASLALAQRVTAALGNVEGTTG